MYEVLKRLVLLLSVTLVVVYCNLTTVLPQSDSPCIQYVANFGNSVSIRSFAVVGMTVRTNGVFVKNVFKIQHCCNVCF